MAENLDNIVDSDGTIKQDRQENNSTTDEKVPVTRGRIHQFKLYDVAEYELVLIEKGSDASLWLNFAIAFLSTFFSMLAALITLNPAGKETAFIILTLITVVSCFGGILCSVFWWKTKGTQKDIFKTIRSRINDGR